MLTNKNVIKKHTEKVISKYFFINAEMMIVGYLLRKKKVFDS